MPSSSRSLSCHLPCMGLNFCKSTDSDEIPFQTSREPVLLNVYDMYKLNDYTGNLGLGIFHSGVEVYGVEYGYAGHQGLTTGIFEMEPRNLEILEEYFNMRGQLKFKQVIHIGDTDLSREEVERLKYKLGRKFRGNKYHLIHNNCNHFSAAFTKLLCKKSIPSWINRLAYVTSFIPFLHKLIPNEMFLPLHI